MNAYSVIEGGRANGRGFGQLGQYHHVVVDHSVAANVTANDIVHEVANRGYVLQEAVHHVPVAHPAPVGITLTKSMAIKISVDMGISQLGIARTATHPYRCPSGTCPLSKSYYDLLISWCVDVANGYLTGRYSIPSWASSMIQSGSLRGLGETWWERFTKWSQEHSWLVESAGDFISNYGEHLTAKNVEDIMKQVQQNTKQSLSKDDIPALVEALKAGGYIQPGQEGIVAAGADAATTPSWMMPAMIGGGVLAVVLLMGRK